MKTHQRLYLGLAILALLAAALAVTAPNVMAQVQSSVVGWWVIASGGATVQTGPVEINATLGQPFTAPATGEDIKLATGFWAVSTETKSKLFIPVVLLNK